MGMDDPPAGSLVEDLFQDDAGWELPGEKCKFGLTLRHSTMPIIMPLIAHGLVAKNTRRAVATFLQL